MLQKGDGSVYLILSNIKHKNDLAKVHDTLYYDEHESQASY